MWAEARAIIMLNTFPARIISLQTSWWIQKPPGTELLPTEQLKKNLEEIGISDDSRVVFYADWDPMATRLFFTLDYLGRAEHAALLDGGME